MDMRGLTGARVDGITLPAMAATFKLFRQFNDPELAPLAGKRVRIDPRIDQAFEGDGLPERLVRALSQRRAVIVKEIFESFELFARVRKRVRAPVVADLCCGHGLTGALFAVFEPTVEHVILLDMKKPKSTAVIMEALAEVAPWALDKIEFREQRVNRVIGELPKNTGVVALHACGVRTDRSIEAATAAGGPLAVVPCCYAQTSKRAPKALAARLGKEMATDIDRTYRLEAQGYQVTWSELPEVITPMNRVIVGTPLTR